MTAKAKKVDTFKETLKRGNSKIREDRAERIAQVAKMDYEHLVNLKKKEIFEIKNKLEEMSDLSTSNVTTTVNKIEAGEFDSQSFVNKRANLRLSLVLKERELEVLEEDVDFYNL